MIKRENGEKKNKIKMRISSINISTKARKHGTSY